MAWIVGIITPALIAGIALTGTIVPANAAEAPPEAPATTQSATESATEPAPTDSAAPTDSPAPATTDPAAPTDSPAPATTDPTDPAPVVPEPSETAPVDPGVVDPNGAKVADPLVPLLGADSSVALNAVSCVESETIACLTLVKKVVGDSGAIAPTDGVWGLQAQLQTRSGPWWNLSWSDTGSPIPFVSGDSIAVAPTVDGNSSGATRWVISEATVPGYNQTSAKCTSGTVSNLRIANNETGSCTFTNTFIPPATITVTAGGVRTATSTVGALPAGAEYTATPTSGSPVGGPFTCTIGAAGSCVITVPVGFAWNVTQTSPSPNYYTSPSLDTGSSSTVTAQNYAFRTDTLSSGASITVAGANPNGGYGDKSSNTFSGLMASSLSNPPAVQKCGLKIALVLDQSGSMKGAKQTALKKAANETITALTGTPSSLAIYTFSDVVRGSVGVTSTLTTNAALPLTTFVNGLGTPSGSTNWDAGLYQVAAGFDIVIFLTDGAPTTFGNGTVDGSNVKFQYVEQGIYSANAIKAAGTRIVGVGIGLDGGGNNLRAVTGATVNSDYYLASNTGFGAILTELATGSCKGSLTIQKQIQDYNGTLISPNPADANGWTFTNSISAGTILPASVVTAAAGTPAVNGLASAVVTANAGTKPTVTVKETISSGYTMVSAACTVGGIAVTTTVDTTTGTASFAADPGKAMACTFVNKQPKPTGTITVNKNTLPANYDQNFGFTLTGNGVSESFTLNDFTDVEGAPWSKSGLVAGTYTVTETSPIPSGWSLTGVNCGTRSGNATTIDLKPGETVNCTFTNTAAPASVKLTKSVEGSASATWGPFSVSLTPNATPSGAQSLSNISTVANWSGLVVGTTYTLNEAAVPGWSGAFTCAGLIDASPDAGFQFVATPGLVLSCTLVNTAAPATISVTKTAVGGNGVFEFALQPLKANGTANGTALPLSLTTVGGTATGSFPTQLAGSRFSLTENDPGAGWTPGTLSCTVTHAGGGSPVAIGNVKDFTIAAGDAIACAITNTAKATIVIVKNVAGVTDNATFTFNGNWTTGTPAISGGKFQITTQKVSGAITGSQTFSNVNPGSYTLGEQALAGFDTTKLICVDPSGGTIVDDTNFTAAIGLAPGETVTCTFTNTQRATILVNKATFPANYNQNFDFNFSGMGQNVDFVRNAKTDTAAWSSGLIVPGDYAVTETALANWSLTGIDCGVPNVGENTTAIALTPGATVVCTFTNTADLGKVSLTKKVAGIAPGTAWGPFDLTLTPPGVPSGTKQVSSSTTAVASWDNLTVGQQYTLSEGTVAGWTTGTIVCSGLADEDAAKAGYQFTVTPGMNLSNCEVTNTANSVGVTLNKHVSGVATGAAWSFDFTMTPAPGSAATQTASGSGVNSKAINWTGLTPGTEYTITEAALPTGWTSQAITCSAGDDLLPNEPGYTFVAAANVAVSCNAYNDAVAASLTVTKTAIGADGEFDFVLTPLSPIGSPVTRSVTATNGVAVATTFTGLTPGTRFSLAETDAGAGWTAGALSCTMDGSAISAASFTPPPGAMIACAITNTAKGKIVIAKTVVGVHDGTFDFTGSWLGASPDNTFSIATSGLSGNQTFSNVTPGSYDLAELAQSGYDPTKLECADPSGGTTVTGYAATIDLASGETVTCTYTNTERGSLSVNKNTLPAGFDQDFGFTFGYPNGVPASFDFTLNDSVDNGTETFTNLVPGIYTISEHDVANWKLSSTNACGSVDGTTITVTIEAGGTVDCTFTNAAALGKATVTKSVSDAASTLPWSFDFTLTKDGGSAVPKTVTNSSTSASWDALELGASYTLAESTLPAGWTGAPLVCVGVDGTSDATGYHFTVDQAGFALSCSAINTAAPASVHLEKSVAGVTSGYQWSFDIGLSSTYPGVVPSTKTVTNAANTADWAGLIPGVTYTLKEMVPAGWTGGPLNCGIADSDPTADGFQFVAGVNTTIDCTLLNTATQAGITVTKTATGADGTFAFGLQPLDSDGTPTGTPLSKSVTTVNGVGSASFSPIVPGSRFSIAETANGVGWTAGAMTCTIGGSTINASNFVVNAGDAVSCAITNTAVMPKLTLRKDVVNSHGGTLASDAWMLHAVGPSTIAGISGEVEKAPALVGSYTLSETGGDPVGYSMTDLQCLNGTTELTLTDQAVNLELGMDVTCTFTNTDKPAALTLTKIVDGNETGSVAVPADWTLTATPQAITGQAAVSGNGDPTSAGGVSAVPVFAGTYQLSETGPDGFTPGTWECAGVVAPIVGGLVTIPSGGAVECQITNTATFPKLTLIKNVINEGTDGIATPGDWTLSATGPSPISGVSGNLDEPDAVLEVPVKVGAYTLGEAGTSLGYLASKWSCDKEGFDPDSAILQLTEGDNVTCEITNTAQPEEWTILKSSTPGNGEVQPGTDITYTITVRHVSGVLPTGIVVEDDMSQVLNNATMVGVPNPSVGTASVTGSTLTWDIGTLAGTQTVTYTVHINDDAFGVRLRNVVTLPTRSSCEIPGGCETLHDTPIWQLSKTSDPISGSTVPVGSDITYTLTALNTGLVDIVGATANDDLSDVLSHATLKLPLPDGLILNPAGDGLIWAVPTMEAGSEAVTVEYTVTVNSDAFGETIRNVVTPKGEGGECVPAPSPDRNEVAAEAEAEICTTEHRTQKVDLTIDKTHASIAGGSVAKGDTIQYSLAIGNAGLDAATDVVVTDMLPAGLSYVAGSLVAPDGWSAAFSNGTLTASFDGAFEPGASAVISFKALVGTIDRATLLKLAPTLNNTACVVAAQADANAADNCDTDKTPLAPPVVPPAPAALPSTGVAPLLPLGIAAGLLLMGLMLGLGTWRKRRDGEEAA